MSENKHLIKRRLDWLEEAKTQLEDAASTMDAALDDFPEMFDGFFKSDFYDLDSAVEQIEEMIAKLKSLAGDGQKEGGAE